MNDAVEVSDEARMVMVSAFSSPDVLAAGVMKAFEIGYRLQVYGDVVSPAERPKWLITAMRRAGAAARDQGLDCLWRLGPPGVGAHAAVAVFVRIEEVV